MHEITGKCIIHVFRVPSTYFTIISKNLKKTFDFSHVTDIKGKNLNLRIYQLNDDFFQFKQNSNRFDSINYSTSTVILKILRNQTKTRQFLFVT